MTGWDFQLLVDALATLRVLSVRRGIHVSVASARAIATPNCEVSNIHPYTVCFRPYRGLCVLLNAAGTAQDRNCSIIVRDADSTARPADVRNIGKGTSRPATSLASAWVER